MPRRSLTMFVPFAVLVPLALASCAPALAAPPCEGCTGWWHVLSGARPSYLPPAHEENGKEVPGSGQIVVTFTNLGDAPIGGASSPVTVTDTLPEGLLVSSSKDVDLRVYGTAGGPRETWGCSVSAGVVRCSGPGPVLPYGAIEMIIDVEVQAGASSGEQNAASVSGGGVAPASVAHKITIAAPGQQVPFGVEQFEESAEEPGGTPDTQASSHPFQVATTVVLNQSQGGFNEKIGQPEAEPAALAKDIDVRLPPGLIGNPTPVAQCPLLDFYHQPHPTCSPQTVVGVAITRFTEPGVLGLTDDAVPIFNLEPQQGEPARFGYLVTNVNPVFIDTAVASGEDYAIVAKVQDITQTAAFLDSEDVFWGVPGDARHDASRGDGCLGTASEKEEPCRPLEESSPPPFFQMPTSCTGPLTASIAADSWSEPRTPGSLPQLATGTMPALDGCNRLPFDPSISATPDGDSASSSTGLTVDVHNPQQSSLLAEGLGEADPRDITVALPEGVAVNPSGGDGLQACSEGLVGFKGFQTLPTQPGFPTAVFSPWYPGSFVAKAAVADGEAPAGEANLEPGLNFCANASKIGEVQIKTPLLPKPLNGFVYIAAQNQNPFGSLIAMYVVVEEERSGVTVKLAGNVQLNPQTGQLVTTFENSPQAAFEDAEFKFFGGERAPLATPARCGAYTTTASFVPWSAESWDEVAKTVNANSTFDITSGPHESPCPGASLPFNPSLTGGATNIDAGGFTPLSTTIGREDGEQNLSQVTLRFPPGLSGLLSNVSLCGEQQANEGKCPESSLIGETTVSAGVGSDPVSVTGGKVYITEKYHGAPFGLSIVNPVKAGPFDLEHDTSPGGRASNNDPPCDCVVVRAKIEVSPRTAALTVTTNSEKEGYAIPHVIDGIPVQIRRVNVTINAKKDFTINPTDCDPMKIEGSVESDEGASKPVEVPLQVTNCAALKFEPKVEAFVNSDVTKENGTSFAVKISKPAVQGEQADLQRFKIELPKQLPSRLTTLQKACTSQQFEADPAGCPAASAIGYMRALTPLLPVPVEGPMYFVSHGGEAFPSLEIVLQGDGVEVELVGQTLIKNGITSSTFATLPDVPFTFAEAKLHNGPYSALTGLGNLCQQKLTMPTELVAQSGGNPILASTPVTVEGCAPAIYVTAHKVKNGVATLTVSVPSAGRLTASAKGLSKASAKARGAGTLTVRLHLTRAETAFLSHHRGRRLRARIRLTFKPAKGARKLGTSVSVLIG